MTTRHLRSCCGMKQGIERNAFHLRNPHKKQNESERQVTRHTNVDASPSVRSTGRGSWLVSPPSFSNLSKPSSSLEASTSSTSAADRVLENAFRRYGEVPIRKRRCYVPRRDVANEAVRARAFVENGRWLSIPIRLGCAVASEDPNRRTTNPLSPPQGILHRTIFDRRDRTVEGRPRASPSFSLLRRRLRPRRRWGTIGFQGVVRCVRGRGLRLPFVLLGPSYVCMPLVPRLARIGDPPLPSPFGTVPHRRTKTW